MGCAPSSLSSSPQPKTADAGGGASNPVAALENFVLGTHQGDGEPAAARTNSSLVLERVGGEEGGEEEDDRTRPLDEGVPA